MRSELRFLIWWCGRRSGKSEIAKRKCALRSLGRSDLADGWTVYGAPTHQQAKRIAWKDLKSLIPTDFMAGAPSESELTVRLVTGWEITVGGMDKPERFEGRPIDELFLDEFANMKPKVWTDHLFPALSTPNRPGRACIFGTPEGRNHFYKLARHAQKNPQLWGWWHWKSAEVLPESEILLAKETLDDLTFQQEYEASFLNFEGRAYWPFASDVHAIERVPYDPALPLILCFDFNRSPGIAVAIQEQAYKGTRTEVAPVVTAAVGEVFIPRNSNTPAVCRKLIELYGKHPGQVLLYGDATGGAKTSSSVRGSDWDLIDQELRPVFGKRLKSKVRKSNPSERARINAVNSRLLTADGKVHFLVDPAACPNLVEDFDGSTLKVGGAGELDKDADPDRTHQTDAVGYYVHEKHPIRGKLGGVSELI
jgi:hypothetical protein